MKKLAHIDGTQDTDDFIIGMLSGLCGLSESDINKNNPEPDIEFYGGIRKR